MNGVSSEAASAPTPAAAPGAYTSWQKFAILASCILGFGLDLYDVLLLPFLMGRIQDSLHVGLTAAAAVASAALLGSVLGGALFGVIGDRLGRKQALQLTLGVFAVGSLLSAVAPTFWILLVLRFVTGIGLGGEWGAGMVLFSEVWNPKRRGLGSACIQGASVLAASSAAVVAVWAMRSFPAAIGWRVALATGGAPLILMIFVRFFMPESHAWTTFARTRAAQGLQVKTRPLVELFDANIRWRTISTLLWMGAFMSAFYSISVFLPLLMMKQLHTPPEVVRNISILGSLAGGGCYLAVGLLSDRFGRRPAALVPFMGWVLAAIGLAIFGRTHFMGDAARFPMLWIALAFSVGNTALGVAGSWLSELFPIQVRSTAVSFAYMSGRAIGSLSPMLVPLIAAHYGGDLSLGMLVAAPAMAIFLLLSLVLPETRGADLVAG